MKYCLAVLTFNEIDGLTELYSKIPYSEFDEYFAVDGGSTDGTLEFFRDKGFPVIIQEKRGRGEAFKLAFEKSLSDVVVIYSPDGNENPQDLVKFIKIFNENETLDLLIASRMMKGAYNEEDDKLFKWRKWANNIFNLGANLFFNKSLFSEYITDSINGYRGFKKTSFEKLNIDASGYTVEYQSTIRSLKRKYKIKEFPTIENPRIGGESYAKSIPTGIKFIQCLLKELFYK